VTDPEETPIPMTDVFTMLRNDHRHVDDLLDRLGVSEAGAERNEMIEELSQALTLQLLELARDAGIEGRSQMTKDQLQRALVAS